MEEPITEYALTGTELKNQVRAKQIIDLLTQGYTYTQIAEELNLSRTQLYAIMNQQGVQQLMRAELTELETSLQTLLKQLEESPSPQDKRTAAVELGKMVRHTKDKILPHLTTNLNIDITLDLNRLHQELNRHNQTLRNLPPTIRETYWNTYNQLYPNQ